MNKLTFGKSLSLVSLVILLFSGLGTSFLMATDALGSAGDQSTCDAKCQQQQANEKAALNQPAQDPAAGKTCGADANCNSIFTKYLTPVIQLLSAAVGVVIVAVIIFSGIQFSASGGDPQAVASAKGHIQNAVIALVAFIFLWAFLNFLIPGGVFNG